MHAERQLVAQPQLLQRDADGQRHRPGGDQRPAMRRRAQELSQAARQAHRTQPIGSFAVSDLVITEDREAVRHVVLNRPEKRNALNEDLVLAIGAALRAAADDPAVRCVVLRGNGPVFSAGMDVAALAGAADEPRAAARVPARVPRRLEPRRGDDQAGRSRRSTASASAARWSSRWPATCACCREDAFVGLPETRLGLVPDLGGSSRLPQVVGVGRAKELIMTGARDRRRGRRALRARQPRGRRRSTRRPTSWSASCWPARRSPSGWRSA